MGSKGPAAASIESNCAAAKRHNPQGATANGETADGGSSEIRTSPKHLQAALYSALTGKQKGRALRTGDAYLLYDSFCRQAGLTPLTQRAFSDLLSELDMYGFIRASTVSLGRYGRTKEIYASIAPVIIEQMKRLILSNFDLSNEVIHE